MIKKLLNIATISSTLLLGSLTYAADIDVNANLNDVAIQGYDPVAYFVKGGPVQGSTRYTATYKNATYQFSSADNRDAFRANPEKFAPQFGGFCTYGVTKERKFDTDPMAWKISDGKLYLNLNKGVQKTWLKDVPGNIVAANGIWSDIKNHTDEQLEDR